MTETIPKYRLFIARYFWSLFGAGFLLFWDLSCGTFAFSALGSPIWFLVSIVRSCITRPGWRIALCRAAIPPLILAIALANTLIQWKKADANGDRIVRACEAFRSDSGHYPNALDELVPRYLPSIPRATYGVAGEFNYVSPQDGLAPILWWNPFAPGKKCFSFERKKWYYSD